LFFAKRIYDDLKENPNAIFPNSYDKYSIKDNDKTIAPQIREQWKFKNGY
jgi:hypothetical protein